MATLEALKRKVEATEDLHSVVRTMKALAAVNIRQYEEAAAALVDYRRTVELGLRIVARHARARRRTAREQSGTAALVVIGSDQGMCGQFNEDAAQQALRVLQSDANDGPRWLVLAIGEKLHGALTARGGVIEVLRHVPSSTDGITTLIRGLLTTIERWQVDEGPLGEVRLVHNRYEQQDVTPGDRRLLPLDETWLRQIQEARWPTRALPMSATAPDELLSHLVQQYLFVQLYAALAESLAAENATRLRAMQSAEKNVEERLDELSARYHRQRQNSITAELLDVISGSEAVAASDSGSDAS